MQATLSRLSKLCLAVDPFIFNIIEEEGRARHGKGKKEEAEENDVGVF